MIFNRSIAIAMLALGISAPSYAAEQALNWNEETLTGDWGIRSNLEKKGVILELVHKSDILSNTSGGLKRGTAWIGHNEARIKMDLEKLASWNATSAYIHYHDQLGSKFNNHHVGSFIGVSNIEASTNTAQFYHAWVQKGFLDNNLTVLGGLYPIDAEFFVTETSGIFIQPPYGMSNDVAQPISNAKSPPHAPPIFPIAALALRVKYKTPNNKFYLQGAITDGVPGSESNPYGTHVQLHDGEGSLSIFEIGYTPVDEAPEMPREELKEESEYFNKTAIGFWRYSATFDDMSDVDSLGNPLHRKSSGMYFLTERTLMTEKKHPSHGLSGFFRLGSASKDIHQADWTGSLGLRYKGLFEGRDNDIAGIAVTVNHTSHKYRALNNSDNHETDLEINYRAQIRSWFALQPNLQYIVNPNMDPAVQNVWIIGARVEIIF